MRFHPLLLFVTVGLLLYFPVFFAGFAGDDQAHFHIVQKNYAGHPFAPFEHVIGSPDNNRILGYFYRPLPFLIYTTILTITGSSALPFHIVQILLYILAAYLLYVFYRRFFPKNISLLLGVIFLIHPANNDLGAYIAALDETACLLFGILALLLIKKHPSTKRAVAVFIAILFSLFSKETGVIFAALAITYSGYKKAFIYTLPVLLAMLAYGLFRINAAENPVFLLTPSPTVDLSTSEHLFLSLQIAFTFLKEITLPTRSGIKPGAFDPSWHNSILPAIMLGLFFIACFGLWKFLKRHNKKRAVVFTFFFCWILLGIPLHLQFIPLEVIFSDRWLYITEIGMLGILGVTITSIPAIKDTWFTIVRTLFIVMLFLYAIQTFVLNFMWLHWEKYFL
jgi:hypothetical protein